LGESETSAVKFSVKIFYGRIMEELGEKGKLCRLNFPICASGQNIPLEEQKRN
jgi:hypothetical protein